MWYWVVTSLRSLPWFNSRGVKSTHHCHYIMASADSAFDVFSFCFFFSHKHANEENTHSFLIKNGKFFIFLIQSIVRNCSTKAAEFQDISPRLTLEKKANTCRWEMAKNGYLYNCLLPWQLSAIYSYEQKRNPRHVASLWVPGVETNSSFLGLHPSSGVDTVNTLGSHLKITLVNGQCLARVVTWAAKNFTCWACWLVTCWHTDFVLY